MEAERREVGYLLFDSHTDAMQLYELLKQAALRCTLAPTPRECSVCCGVCVRMERPEDLPRALALAEENAIHVSGSACLAAAGRH